MRVAAALAAATLLVAGCDNTQAPFARARAIDKLDDAIGGPNAQARVGDFLLENDQIRAVVEKGGKSYAPADVGGTLLDIDLVRSEPQFRGGNGLDQLGQIAPIENLFTAHATFAENVRITRSSQGAEVTAAAEAEPAFRILLALNLLVARSYAAPPIATNMYTEYVLRPGERMLRMRTTVGFNVPFCPVTPEDGCNPECDDAIYDSDCVCPTIPARCVQGARHVDATTLPDRPSASLLDILLGDLPRPLSAGTCDTDKDCNQAAGETCVHVSQPLGGKLNVCRSPAARDAGVVLGDLLVFGAHYTPFVRGLGYDTETDIRRLFDTNQDTLSQPLVVDTIFATGDRLSLAYAAPGSQIYAPIFRGPFALGATHAATCATQNPGCLEKTLVRYDRWLAVGTGDVASAEAPLLTAGGKPSGRIRGTVTETPTGKPMPHIDVYAVRDPRTLPCDAACKARCPDVDASIASWTLDQLRGWDRCRTVEPRFPNGTSAVETFARTNPGTDPMVDGRFDMRLAPGDYVLVAFDKQKTRSRPVAVTVSDGSSAEVHLELPQPSGLEYTIYDESARPGPGKLTIGRLPDRACAADSDCPAGEQCRAGMCSPPWSSLLPLEFGGPRPVDGVLWTEQSLTGKGRVELPAGDYDVLFSRGPHDSVDRVQVTLEPRIDTQVQGFVRRVVDRKGWTAAGFHSHSSNSVDSGLAQSDRVTGYVAEDMDLLSSSDHDVITQYDPLVRSMGLGARLGTMAGVEITTQEYGHYVAFPLHNEAWSGGQRLPGNDAVQWRTLLPQQIVDAARTRGLPGLPVVIDMPHPYDYYDFYRVDPVTLEPTSSLLVIINPVLDPSAFTGDFEVMELANTKNFHRIRRATVGEIRTYEQALDHVIGEQQSGAIDEATFEHDWLNLATENMRRILHRTVAEQEAELAGDGSTIACLCGGDGSCGVGQVCDAATMTCVDAPGTGSAPPPPNGMCRLARGVIDDWFNMLNRGVFRTGVAGADEHDAESAFMRTMIKTGGTTTPFVQPADVIDALQRGRSVVTNGPMVHFAIGAADIGDTLPISAGAEVELHVRVEKASWYDVDRIEIYRNGHLIQWANGCAGGRGATDEDPDTLPCIAEGDAVLAWDQTITDTPDRDSWYVVLVYGLDGRMLTPVYTSQILAEINTPEITRRLFQIIPGLQEFRYPRQPTIYPVFPFAFTNPIWVDVGGDGWTPPLPPPSWCQKRDVGCMKTGP
jgi:hypothetical protein